jgi:hypothetical protein
MKKEFIRVLKMALFGIFSFKKVAGILLITIMGLQFKLLNIGTIALDSILLIYI